jgi:hypothetical protein
MVICTFILSPVFRKWHGRDIAKDGVFCEKHWYFRQIPHFLPDQRRTRSRSVVWRMLLRHSLPKHSSTAERLFVKYRSSFYSFQNLVNTSILHFNIGGWLNTPWRNLPLFGLVGLLDGQSISTSSGESNCSTRSVHVDTQIQYHERWTSCFADTLRHRR